MKNQNNNVNSHVFIPLHLIIWIAFKHDNNIIISLKKLVSIIINISGRVASACYWVPLRPLTWCYAMTCGVAWLSHSPPQSVSVHVLARNNPNIISCALFLPHITLLLLLYNVSVTCYFYYHLSTSFLYKKVY
jgi:hypothetical protein